LATNVGGRLVSGAAPATSAVVVADTPAGVSDGFATAGTAAPDGEETQSFGLDWVGLVSTGPMAQVSGTVVGAVGSSIQLMSLNTDIASLSGLGRPPW
jgi:hypothetical protein